MPPPVAFLQQPSVLAQPAPLARSGDGAAGGVGAQPAQGWFLLAIGSLVLAGLLSLMLVVGRLPFLAWLFTDPLFFKRALVVHVDLAIVVWFQAGTLAFLGWAVGPRLHRGVTAASLALATTGVAGLLIGAVMPGAQPVLANYVPVIDHPVFFGGLICFHEKACRGLYIKRFTFFVAGLGPGFPLVRLPYALWVAASIGRTVQGGVLDSGKGMALLTGYRIL